MYKLVFGPRPHISEERTGVVVISNINIDLGTSGANISCSTYSVLPTQLTWSSSFEGNSIPSGIIPTTLGRQVLNLIWTRPSLYADSGEYKCTATNARGSNTATVAVLVSSEYSFCLSSESYYSVVSYSCVNSISIHG